MISSANLRGILLMILGMAGLAVTDALLKLLAGSIPIGQLMVIQGVGGTLIFGTLALRNGDTGWRAKFLLPITLWRNLFEMIAAASFLTALVLVPLSTLSSILQANPLIVTLGAALWLHEPVGPRRWAAIMVGLCGVLLIIRPWSDSFDAAALICILATVALALRDLLTRRLPASITTYQAATFAVALMPFVGIALSVIQQTPFVVPSASQTAIVTATVLTMPIGYWGVTAAMRV
ncbi:MAG: DMT family transporter, partial [Tateyamaria sp.]